MKWLAILALYATTTDATAHVRQAVTGAISDQQQQTPIPLPTQCPDQETDVDYYGHDIRNVVGISNAECCDECRATSNCAAYTFLPVTADGTSVCYLKTSSAGRRLKQGAISARTTDTPTPTRPILQCPEREADVDYYGNDITSYFNIAEPECCTACGSTAGCTAYTYIDLTEDGKPACYLKSSADGKRSKKGAVSAKYKAPTPTPTPPPNPFNCPGQLPWISFGGKDIKVIPDLLTSECCDACGATNGCAAYTLVLDMNPDGRRNGTCHLKDSVGGWNKVPDVVSAAYHWTPSPPPPPPPAKCPKQEIDIDYYGNDIKPLYDITNAQCCDECSTTSGCAAFTFIAKNDDGQSACYLKTSSSGRVAKPGAVSAEVKLVGPAKCPMVEKDVDFYGNDIKPVYGVSFSECCDECDKTTDCAAYTFIAKNDDGRTACYLKTSSSGRVAKPGAISAQYLVPPKA